MKEGITYKLFAPFLLSVTANAFVGWGFVTDEYFGERKEFAMKYIADCNPMLKILYDEL